MWQLPSTPWKRILKQAWKTALLQEHMMVDIQVLHGRIFAVLKDGGAEFAFYDLYKVLPRTDCLDRIEFLKQKHARLQAEEAAPSRPHRPVRTGTANPGERRRTIQQVPSCYDAQADWLAAIRQMQWRVLPEDPTMPIYRSLQGRPHFLSVHIFLEGAGKAMCIAVWRGGPRLATLTSPCCRWTLRSPWRMAICRAVSALEPAGPVLWARMGVRDPRRHTLRDLQRGTFPGVGSCTWWSSSTSPLQPATTFEIIWAAPWATGADTAWACTDRRRVNVLPWGPPPFVFSNCRGGCFISEHLHHHGTLHGHLYGPLRGSMFYGSTQTWSLHITPQWPFGASVPKPTGLLALRLPLLMRSLYRHAEPGAVRPNAVAIGANPMGRSDERTQRIPVEVLRRPCPGATDFLDHNLRTGRTRLVPPQGVDFELHRWISEAKEACAEIRQGAVWLPDYQRL